MCKVNIELRHLVVRERSTKRAISGKVEESRVRRDFLFSVHFVVTVPLFSILHSVHGFLLIIQSRRLISNVTGLTVFPHIFSAKKTPMMVYKPPAYHLETI
ncbi:hypothetical protein T07_7146 [Trichinella nelsoni]|uniref:Uncharacterized protein n=1 Tax=Trichinella nelsoni TaxID=6336 RepID=A0A0V0S6B4_9BILA|nr:hypothetical protein T07_7146 [Trichinella nelsoni]